MTELEEKIKSYADSYYQGKELIDDSEYDALIEQLRKEKPESELLPENQGIAGSDLKGVSKKYKLPITMGTLAKCNSDEEFKEWWEKHNHDDLVAQLKLDGNSQVLHYKNGEFKYSRSRGNGEIGEDTTFKFDAISVPKKLKVNFTGNIRGEVLLKRSVWKQYFSDTKNPRNCAAGLMGRLDNEGCDKLSFIAYDVFDDANNYDKTEITKLDFLTDNGFEVPVFQVSPTFDDIIAWKNSLDTANSEIPVDGIVIKQNKTDKEDLMRHTPLNNVALKPELQTASTTLKEIRWFESGKYLTPVAVFDPVELEGTTVTKASLANVNIMNQLGVYVGATVFVEKRGMIIPKISKVLNPKENAFTIPTICPACGAALFVNSSGMVECPNESCLNKGNHQLKKFFKIFGIKGAGDSFVSKFAEKGNVKTLLDYCSGGNEKILNEFAGGINGQKIFKQVKDVIFNKKITSAQFLAILDNKLFDQKRLEMLGDLTLDEMLNLSKNDLLSFKGFSDITADAYLKMIHDNEQNIKDLRNYFIFEDKKQEEKKDMDEKITVVFTGASTNGMTRNELSAKAIEAGYEVQNSVTGKTKLLVCADPNSNSSKMQKAKKNGTEIISYDEFCKRIGL